MAKFLVFNSVVSQCETALSGWQVVLSFQACNCRGVKLRDPLSFEGDTNLPLRWHGFSFVICFAILTVLMRSFRLCDVFGVPEQAVADIYPPKYKGTASAVWSWAPLSCLIPNQSMVCVGRDIFTIKMLWQTFRKCCCPPWKYSIGNQERDEDSRSLVFRDQLIAVHGSGCSIGWRNVSSSFELSCQELLDNYTFGRGNSVWILDSSETVVSVCSTHRNFPFSFEEFHTISMLLICTVCFWEQEK